MKAKLKQLVDRLDALSVRERALIFLMLASILTASVYVGALSPLSAQQKKLTQQIAQNQARIQAAAAQMQIWAEAAKHDPDAQNKLRLAELNAKRSSAYGALTNLEQGLVTAKRMPQVLRGLLGKNPHLKLVAIKTLPASRFVEDEPEPGAGAKAKPTEKAPVTGPGLYKHGLEISIEGSYADLLAYLAELEKLPWRIYWGGVTLSAREYPISRLTLTLYTLSMDKTWLSV